MNLKDNLWILGIVAAVLLFLNIFVPGKSQRYYEENQVRLPEKASKNYKTLNSTEMLNTNATSSLNFPAFGGIPLLRENLRLLGTIIGSPSLAFITDLTSGKYNLYKLNDLIAGAKIVEITPGRVALERDGARQELLLKDSAMDVREDKRLVIAAVSPNEMVVSKSGLINQMDKANELLARVRILPVADTLSDKLKGFRIDNVPSGSIIEQAGVKSGDIICSVAGQRLESTEDALRVFSGFGNQSRIEVDLLRDDKPVTLRYDIRD